jgi:hypothetical protein
MPKKKEQPEEKHPIEMTTEELLDCTIAPEVAERLREIVRESEEPEVAESEELS